MFIKRYLSSSSTLYSHIGKSPIKYSSDVKCMIQPLENPTKLCQSQIYVQGPQGVLQRELPHFLKVSIDLPENSPKYVLSVSVNDPTDKFQKAMWGTMRAHINNMIEGVTEGYILPIRFEGVGYKAILTSPTITLSLGYAHPIILEIPSQVQVKIPNPQRIVLQSVDKEAMTQFAAQIRKWRVPEPYNQKGVFVGDETIKKKEGKKR